MFGLRKIVTIKESAETVNMPPELEEIPIDISVGDEAEQMLASEYDSLAHEVGAAFTTSAVRESLGGWLKQHGVKIYDQDKVYGFLNKEHGDVVDTPPLRDAKKPGWCWFPLDKRITNGLLSRPSPGVASGGFYHGRAIEFAVPMFILRQLKELKDAGLFEKFPQACIYVSDIARARDIKPDPFVCIRNGDEVYVFAHFNEPSWRG